MKAKLLVSALLVGLFSVVNYGNVQAQDKNFDKQAIAMLKEFYTAYISEFSKPPTPANLAKSEALPKKYCTTSLLNKINARFKNGYVNSDPFIFAQDTDDLMLKTLSVNKDLKKVNSYTVSYRFRTTPEATEKEIIHLTVIKQGEKFKISSIR